MVAHESDDYAGEPQYFGALAEAASKHRYDLEDDHASWHDSRTRDGRPVESKTCRRRLASGCRGRIWIEKEAHETLLANDGLYAISVYDPHEFEDGPILDATLIEADEIDPLLTWTSSGGHHKGGTIAKLNWTHVLEVGLVECIVFQKGGEAADD